MHIQLLPNWEKGQVNLVKYKVNINQKLDSTQALNQREVKRKHHFLISNWLFLAPTKVHILLLHHHKNLIRVTHTEGPTQATLHPSHGTYHIGNSIPPLIAVIAAF